MRARPHTHTHTHTPLRHAQRAVAFGERVEVVAHLSMVWGETRRSGTRFLNGRRVTERRGEQQEAREGGENNF